MLRIIALIAGLNCAQAGLTLYQPDGTPISSSYNYTCPSTDANNPVTLVGCPCTVRNVNITRTEIPALALVGNSPRQTPRKLYAYLVNQADVISQCDNGVQPCGICPEASQCSVQTASVGFLSYTVAYCSPCMFGQYCPQGTINQNGNRLNNLCGAGALCADPITKDSCPDGYFCPQSSFRNITCYQKTDDITGIGGGQIGFLGNYCGENSTHPFTKCPAGFYCPDSATRIKCPEGHYCPEMSLSPKKCWALSNCQSGTSKPPFSWLGFIIVLAAAVVAVGVGYVFQRQWKVKQAALKEDEIQNERVAKLRSSLFQSVDPNIDMFNPVALRKKKFTLKFEFEHLGLLVSEKQVISGISGTFKPSRLVAIMGPSGCGKLILLSNCVDFFVAITQSFSFSITLQASPVF
jgi:hypothetical protein